MSQKKLIILVAILVVSMIISGLLIYSLWLKAKILQIEKTIPKPQIVRPEDFGAGKIGEITEEKNLSLPPAVFNTTGIINEIKKDGLIVQGSGSNFADQVPRTLTLIFTEATTVFEPGQKVFYQGLEGLKYLKPGMEILIDGDENIRGKTEFKTKTINIL